MPVSVIFGSSSNKGKTPPETPLLVPIIDKITITFKLHPAHPAGIYKTVYEAVANQAIFLPAKPSPRFHIVQLIPIPGSAERVRFMFHPKKGYLPDAQFEFNPAKLGAKGVESLHHVLSLIFPGGWGFLVEYGRVSSLDVAVDLPGVRMHHFHLLPNQVLTWKTYEDGAKLKTTYVGKPKGNQLKLYSKSHEVWVKAKKKVPKGPPVVRVEKRLRNVGLLVKNLDLLGNPLTGFKLVAHPAGPREKEGAKGKWFWPFFLAEVALHGLGPALKKLRQNRMAIYRKHFADHAQPWWNPEAIWAQWPQVLKHSKLVDGWGPQQP